MAASVISRVILSVGYSSVSAFPSVARRLQVLAFIGVHWRLREFASLLYPSRSKYGEKRFLRAYLFIPTQGSEILRQVNLNLRNDGVRCSSHLSGTIFHYFLTRKTSPKGRFAVRDQRGR
jgi:hypothetical protein